jgi:hypothetical protein
MTDHNRKAEQEESVRRLRALIEGRKDYVQPRDVYAQRLRGPETEAALDEDHAWWHRNTDLLRRALDAAEVADYVGANLALHAFHAAERERRAALNLP